MQEEASMEETLSICEGVSKSCRTGRLERELQMVQLSATRCSCIAILWVSLVSFVAITLRVASQRVIPKVSVYFVMDSVRKLLVPPSYRILVEDRDGNWVNLWMMCCENRRCMKLTQNLMHVLLLLQRMHLCKCLDILVVLLSYLSRKWM
jgi:hypothetical protein